MNIKTHQNKTQPPYTKKQLLTHIQACDKAPLSYKEMADVVGCSKKFAKIVAKENEAAKVIAIEKTSYKFGISGKNKYSRGENFSPKKHLIPGIRVVVKKVGRQLIINVMFEKKCCNPSQTSQNSHYKKKEFPTKSNINSNSKEFAKASPGRPSVKLEVLKRHGFEKFAKGAPSWWFRDIARLEKALKLLQAKLKHGFSPKNFFKFISHLLKNEVSGYRKWRVVEFLKDFQEPSIQRVNKYFENEFRTKAWEDFSTLFNQQKFKLNFDTAQKLLRRGFQHAAKCAEVSLKRLKLGGIECTTGFTLSLVKMQNPMDILTKNQVRTC